jgi:hypothetical protein
MSHWRRLIEKKTYEYKGPVFSDIDPLKINMTFKVKLGDEIELFHAGTPKNYISTNVIITEMDTVSTFLFGNLLKNLNTRLEVDKKFWYLGLQLTSILDYEVSKYVSHDEVKFQVTSIHYIGEVPDKLSQYF